MSISPIHNLTSSYLEKILGTASHETGLTTSPTSAGVRATSTQPDNGQLSPFAELLSSLHQLEKSNPTQHQRVTAQIASNLESSAQTATADGNTSAASQLNQLATDFNNASQSGSSSTIATSSSDSVGSNQTGVNPYASPTAQTSQPPAGYQYVPFGTGTSVVPTMSNWLAGWSNATDNMSPEAQLNQILQSDYSNNPMFPGGNLPGTNIAADSLTQEQLAAYVQMTGTGQAIDNLQEFLSQYQGPNTLGNESYDQASSNPQAAALLQQDAAAAAGVLS